MSLIVLQHTVADNFNVDPNWSITSQGTILAGSLVGLDANGNTKIAGLQDALGIAGDSLSNEYKTTAFSADLVISPSGATRWTQNRIDNYFNETLASGMMTVYTTGGLFATDQYATGPSYTPGVMLYCNGSGQFTTVNSGGTSRKVGYVSKAPGAYPSGVPGVDSPSVDNSMSLGNYLQVQLSI